ncbi:MAG: AbrB/MazE/SpoVT family DNA-binding domain-containing protein [Lachnospiraceae bacterium]
MDNLIINNVKVMSRGRITIPKDIRVQLGVDVGDEVTFICKENQVIMISAAVDSLEKEV